ncbi:MAG: DUF6027 family protein [Solirubrobacterales bacterium]
MTPTIELEAWTGPWPDDDRDANLKADVVAHAKLDPLGTLRRLSANTDIPLGALVHYVLARYATSGSGGLLELGPSMVNRLWEPIEKAENDGGDAARLEAYDQVRQMLSWLRYPLDHEEVYPAQSPKSGA